MNIKSEKLYPYAGGMILTGVGLWTKIGFPVWAADSKAEAILTNGITVASILVGFLTAALALLPSLNSPVMDRIRATKYFNLLMGYLREGIWSCFAMVIFSFIGFWLQGHTWYPAVWFGLAAVAFLSFYRVTKIVFDISAKSG